jgi:putative membrane protein
VVTAALIFAGLAAVLHVYIFVLESLQWTAPRTRATFGTTLESAEATKELAFNQGCQLLARRCGLVSGLVG